MKLSPRINAASTDFCRRSIAAAISPAALWPKAVFHIDIATNYFLLVVSGAPPRTAEIARVIPSITRAG